MKISRTAFDELRRKGGLVISLIGMSNTGKTHWARELHAAGFAHLSCDDVIEEKLGNELRDSGYHGISDVSRWMGQPFEKHYKERSARYLALEEEALSGIIEKLKSGWLANAVVDTTGSFVHLPSSVCELLKAHSLVVYIAATPELREELFQRYVARPKPVIFGDAYGKKEGETDMQSLERSYKDLLAERTKLYERYADVTVSYASLKEAHTPEAFISRIEEAL